MEKLTLMRLGELVAIVHYTHVYLDVYKVIA